MFNGFDGPSSEFSWQEPDIILSYLVSSLVNMAGAPVGITLMVKGTILTGTLISEREYLEDLSEMLQAQIRRSLVNATEDERLAAESAFDLTDFLEDSYPDPDDFDEDDEDFPMPGFAPLFHLHLKDPVVISPQPSIGFSDGLFSVIRIRLSNIDGWMLGSSIPGMNTPPNDREIRH
jgi:hypothetical protein